MGRALERLGEIGSTRSIPKLLLIASAPLEEINDLPSDPAEALRSKNQLAVTNHMAILRVLRKSLDGGNEAQVIRILLEDLPDGNPNRKQQICAILGGIGHPAQPAVPHLTRLLEDADPEVRKGAARAIREIEMTEDERMRREAERIRKNQDPLERIEASFSYQKRPQSELLDFLQQVSGLTISLDPAIDSREILIDISVQNLTLREGLDAVLTPLGLGYSIQGKTISITPKP